MSRLLCCRRARQADMGAALSLSHPQEGEACDGAGLPAAPPTMADVIRERKKKAGSAGLGTLRRRIAAAARRPRDHRPDRGCEHARYIRSVVSSWRLAEVFLLCEELEAGAALRDLVTQAELAREPAAALHADLATAHRDRWWCDVELVGAGWSVAAHRAILAARCTYFRDLLQHYPSGSVRVPLEGAGGALTREEIEAAVLALYAGSSVCARRPLCSLCAKWERGVNSDGDLDIINVDNTNTYRSGVGSASGWRCGCGRARVEAARIRRLADVLGFSLDTLHRDMRYLLDSGEYADARLSFRAESSGGGGSGGGGGGSGSGSSGCSSAYGFRSALELPCHRVVLAARSRFFRSVMSRRSAGAGGGAVCVDEKVLPRRFARALLHAAYTDQVDLSLVGRPSSPTSAGSTTSSNTAWPGVARGGGGGARSATAVLDDAFQLYEIARFLEMPIVVQGCEDAIVEALTAETLPHVLRWASAPHASHWVHRQAMRYLRDEFPSIMSHAASSQLPRSALADALASPFLQASEPQALRALLRWAERSAHDRAHAPDHREPNVVWHTAHSVSRRGARRREVSDGALREAVAPLVSLVRIEHLPPDSELLHQAVRRGIVPMPPPQMVEGGSPADAWLGRGAARAPRCFLPYLDEIKALLEDQAVPEAEVARVRRTRYLHRIPDTLYMVAAERGNSAASTSADRAASTGGGNAEGSCVSPRALAALRARVRELRAAPPAARALAHTAADTRTVCVQIALRAVREMSLPDSCADLLLADIETNNDRSSRGSGEWEGSGERLDRGWRDDAHDDAHADCCSSRTRSSGSVRCASGGSARSHLAPAHAHTEGSRNSTCRRDQSSRSAESQHHRESLEGAAGLTSNALGGVGGVAPPGGSVAGGRLSAAVPDVAMAPNGNTHLLTARDYFRHATPHAAHHAPWEYSGGGVLQLDLGDGATHTPRPGSRAQRAAQGGRHHREHAQLSTARSRPDDEELRAAIEFSVIRAYSSFAGRPASPGGARCRPGGAATAGGGASSATLPQPYHHAELAVASIRNRGIPSPSALSASNSGHLAAAPRLADRQTPPPAHHSLSRASSGENRAASAGAGGAGASGAGAGSALRTPSPRRVRRQYSLYRHHDYRLEAAYSSGSGSRGPSPSGYA